MDLTNHEGILLTWPLGKNTDIVTHNRYTEIFELPESIPNTTAPGPGYDSKTHVPFIVEAPLNSVEVLEALFKPDRPFTIYTARHVPRQPPSNWEQYPGDPIHKFVTKNMCEEYQSLQGRLEEDVREISYVCINMDSIFPVQRMMLGQFRVERLYYISIPWATGVDADSLETSLVHPWALFLHEKEAPGTIHTYENQFRELVKRLGLVGCDFRRSLLRRGTTPLPETCLDWFCGNPGKTAALPYFAPEDGQEKESDIMNDFWKEADQHRIPMVALFRPEIPRGLFPWPVKPDPSEPVPELTGLAKLFADIRAGKRPPLDFDLFMGPRKTAISFAKPYFPSN